MKGTFAMSRQPNFLDLLNATSSPESASGPARSDEPDGPMIARSGQDRALASLSARQASERGLMTSGTFGQRGIGLSSKGDLASSLASKLRARTASGGSILYRLTWQELATPEGRSIWQLRASGWSGGAAPNRNGWSGPYAFVQMPWSPDICLPLPSGLIRLLHSGASTSGNGSTLSGWPTATAKASAGAGTTDPEKSLARAKGPHSNDLQDFAQLANYPLTGFTTPNTRDWKDTSGMGTERKDGRKKIDQTPREAAQASYHPEIVKADLAGYSTPMAGSPRSGKNSQAGNSDYLRRTEAMLGREIMGHGLTLTEAKTPIRITAEGEIRIGSSAAMGSGGQLRPEHSRWLMRIPPEWDDCAPTETASTLKRRQSSAAP